MHYVSNAKTLPTYLGGVRRDMRRVIVKPIITFRDAAKLVAKGKLNTEVNIRSHDELGDLASAFNQMTHDLKTLRDKIQRSSKTLENLLKQKDE